MRDSLVLETTTENDESHENHTSHVHHQAGLRVRRAVVRRTVHARLGAKHRDAVWHGR